MTLMSNELVRLRALLRSCLVLVFAGIALSACEDADRAENGETKPAQAASFQTKVIQDGLTLDIALHLPPPQALKTGNVVTAAVGVARDGKKAQRWQLEGTVLQAKDGRAAIRLDSSPKAPEVTLIVSDIGFGDGRFAGWWRHGAKTLSVRGQFELGRWRLDGVRPVPVVESMEADEVRGLPVLRIKGSGFGNIKEDGAIVLNRGGKIDYLPVLEWQPDQILMMRHGPLFNASAFAMIDGNDTPITGIIDRLRGEPVCNEYPWAEKRFDLGAHAEGFAIIRTRDCGFAIAGRIRHGAEDDFDGMVVKLTADGRIERRQDGSPLWPLIIDFDGGPDALTGIVQLRDGSLIVVGTTLNASAGKGNDLLVARITQPLGLQVQPPQVDWIEVIGGDRDEAGTAITEGLMGIAVAGWTESPELEPFGDEPEDIDRSRLGRDGLFAFLRYDGTVTELGRSNRRANDQINAIITTPGGYVGAGYAGRTENRVDVFRPWIVNIGLGGHFSSGSLLSPPVTETVVPNTGPIEVARALSPRRTSDGISVGGISFNAALRPEGAPRALLAGTNGTPPAFTGGDRFGATDMVEIAALERLVGDDLVYAGSRIRDEGGFQNRDGLVREEDCLGKPVGQHLIDMGGDETIHAMTVVYDSPEPIFQSRATDFVVTGGTRDATRNTTDLLVARLQPHAAPAAEILEFTANGDATNHTLSLGDRLEINIVADADSIVIRRLSGVGPELEIDPQSIITGNDGLVHARIVVPAFQLQPGATCASGLAFCGTTLYRVTVRKGTSECGGTVQSRDLALLVGPGAAAQTQALAEMEIISRYGASLANWNRVLLPSHPETRLDGVTLNRCFTNQGKAWAVRNSILTQAGAYSGVGNLFVDPGNPSLILTDNDGDIVGWAHGALFDDSPPQGLNIPDEAWFGHWGGWHIGDGRMVVDPSTNSPSFFCNPLGSDPRCSAIKIPYLMHHRFWDIHIFRSQSTAPPLVQFDLSGTGLPDPCAGISNPLDDCDAHTPPQGPFNSSGTRTRLSLFFNVAGDGTPIRRACIPDQ